MESNRILPPQPLNHIPQTVVRADAIFIFVPRPRYRVDEQAMGLFADGQAVRPPQRLEALPSPVVNVSRDRPLHGSDMLGSHRGPAYRYSDRGAVASCISSTASDFSDAASKLGDSTANPSVSASVGGRS